MCVSRINSKTFSFKKMSSKVPTLSARNLKTGKDQSARVVEIVHTTHGKKDGGSFDRYRAILRFSMGPEEKPVKGSKFLNSEELQNLRKAGVKITEGGHKAYKPRVKKEGEAKKKRAKKVVKKVFDLPFEGLTAEVAEKKPKKPRAKKAAAAGGAAKKPKVAKPKVAKGDRCDSYADAYRDRCLDLIGNAEQCDSIRQSRKEYCGTREAWGRHVRVAPQRSCDDIRKTTLKKSKKDPGHAEADANKAFSRCKKARAAKKVGRYTVGK